MTIWIVVLLVLAASAGLGYRQGSVRTAFSFVGIVVAALLAGPIGSLLKPLLPHMGVHNPALIWFLAPLEAFIVLLFIFKIVGFTVHRKVTVYFKYHAGDLRLALWERLDHRLGLCVGLLNGTAYLVLVSLVIFNLSYLTAQIAPSGDQPWKIRLLNQLGRDLDSAGLDKVARAVDPMPDIYYKLADLVGLICQNPALSDRLADYPAFMSLVERDDVQGLMKDDNFINAWKQQAPISQLLADPQAKSIFQNNELIALVWGILQTDLDDLTTYLKTGQSPKYDADKFIGHWNFNVGATIAAIAMARPNIPSPEMQRARAVVNTLYGDMVFKAAPDHQAFLQNMGRFKAAQQKNQPPTTEKVNFKGDWKGNAPDYDLTLTPVGGGAAQSMTAHLDDGKLTITTGEQILAFRREE